jgi:hypothetical protein
VNKDYIRVFAYFLAANTQAVLLIGAARWLIRFLDGRYPTFGWSVVVWPLCVLGVGHSYYIVIRRLLIVDKKRRDDDQRP